MRSSTLFAPVALAIAAALPAQTQTMRASVEDVQGTQNQFYIDCTNIPAVSSTINLNTIISQEMIFEVVNIGTAANPILDIRSATPTTKVFDMGNLRIGQSARWQVNAPAGSFGMVFLDFTSRTGYQPFGSFGVWLLSSNAVTLSSGFTNAQNQFEFNYTVANVPQLVGSSFTGQALVGTGGTFFLSNPDCKVLENR